MPLGELVDTLTTSAEAISDVAENTVGCSRQDGSNRNSLSETSGNQTAVGSIGGSGSPIVNFHIIVEEKLLVHARRRYEKQV